MGGEIDFRFYLNILNCHLVQQCLFPTQEPMSQKTELYKPITTLHITFREHGHTNMIIRTTAESPYILTDVMQ